MIKSQRRRQSLPKGKWEKCDDGFDYIACFSMCVQFEVLNAAIVRGQTLVE